MLMHPKTKYPEVVAFAKDHPLPKKTEDMADALLDLASIFMACKKHESASWDSLQLQIIHHGYASKYPGAFLSNPAFLPNTTSITKDGYKCLGSHTAGGFFSYSHYQDDSLGTALLMGAFSPRTQKPSRAPSLYAKAMLFMIGRGDIHQANARSTDGIGLKEIAQGSALGPRPSVFFSIEFDKIQLSKLGELRLDASADCIDLALSDDKQGLFSANTRHELGKLSAARRSFQEARNIEQACQDGAPRAASPRM